MEKLFLQSRSFTFSAGTPLCDAMVAYQFAVSLLTPQTQMETTGATNCAISRYCAFPHKVSMLATFTEHSLATTISEKGRKKPREQKGQISGQSSLLLNICLSTTVRMHCPSPWSAGNSTNRQCICSPHLRILTEDCSGVLTVCPQDPVSR